MVLLFASQISGHRAGCVSVSVILQPTYAPVAQLDRAPDFESVGRGFESLQAYHNREKGRVLMTRPFFVD